MKPMKILLANALNSEKGGLALFLKLLITANVIAVIVASLPNLPARLIFFFAVFEIISVGIFILEYLARVITAGWVHGKYKGVKGRLGFLFSPLMVLDLVAILPSFFGGDLRVLRILRLARFYRYSVGMRTVIHVLARKKAEFLSVIFLLLLALIFSSSFLYMAEHPHPDGAFSSIPASMWWAIATLTTVGYGDVVPVTVVGKVLGGLTSIIGIMMVALPTAIISSSFMQEFQHFRQKKQAEQKQKRRL